MFYQDGCGRRVLVITNRPDLELYLHGDNISYTRYRLITMDNSADILHIYCRVSTDTQTRGHSMQAQRKLGVECAGRLGLQYEVHEEPGASGAHDDVGNRPILGRLLELCDEGQVKHIFVTELDRLTRSPILQHKIKRIFVDNGCLIHTTSTVIDLNDEEAEFSTDLTALLSRRENTIRAKRSKRGLKEAALKGKWIGVILPYGYRKTTSGILEPDQEEQNAYMEMVNLCLAGHGTNSIAHILNGRGIPTRCKKVLSRGTKVVNKYTRQVRQVSNSEFVWKPGTVYCILTNPLYKGQRRYKGELIPFPPLVDESKWSMVQVQLKKNKHFGLNNAAKHFYLLKGLLRCQCGCNLYGRIKPKDGENYYMCSSKRTHSCGLRSVNIDRLDTLVWDAVMNNKGQRACLEAAIKESQGLHELRSLREDVAQAEKALAKFDKRKDQLVFLFMSKRIDSAKFDEIAVNLQREKEEAASLISNLRGRLELLECRAALLNSNKVDELRAGGFKMTREEKRNYLQKIIKNIVVSWCQNLDAHYVEIYYHSDMTTPPDRRTMNSRRRNPQPLNKYEPEPMQQQLLVTEQAR